MDVGLYGKLPSHGDFLRRRVSDEFLAVWDEWLQQSIAASREALGEDWLQIYLTCPMWRFACDPGVFGARGYAGVFAPSVDRVGRYFPLTLVWETPEGVNPFTIAQRADRWFDQVERLILQTFAEEQIDLEHFDARLLELSHDLDRTRWQSAVEFDLAQAAALTAGGAAQWQLAITAPPSFHGLTEQLLYARLRETHAPLTLLWSEGSSQIEPCCLMLRGLPAPSTFTALLTGRWGEEGWRVVKARTNEPVVHVDTWVHDDNVAFKSAALSDVGLVRSVNQDAFIERAEVGLWAIADGMGGQGQGEIASRMICDALAEITPGGTLLSTVDQVAEQLHRVNGYLHRAATRASNPVQSGSTAVAVAARGSRYAVLWVGDSRLYRLRAGELTQITRDHVDEDAARAGYTNAITRAVGGGELLDIDVRYGDAQPGDRYLLCSDGLNHEVSDDVIRAQLSGDSPRVCADRLVAAARDAGGGDNITVIVIDACEAMDGATA